MSNQSLRDELFSLAKQRERKPFRGRDIKKMEKPWSKREIVFTCSNGWTIELIDPDDWWLEGLFMGHCLGLERGPRSGVYLSLRDENGSPHVTLEKSYFSSRHLAIGRCNGQPPDHYINLIREWNPEVIPQINWGRDTDSTYHNDGILTDVDYRDLDVGRAQGYKSLEWRQKRDLV